MIIFFQQLVTADWGVFLVFALSAWFVWTVRLWYSLGYQPWTNQITDPRVTILIPTYHESKETLSKSINCILSNRINGNAIAEVIIGIDERELEIKPWLRENFPTCQVIVAPAGKRWAVRTGIEAATYDKICIVESDTFADPDAIEELIRPMEDPGVGGVVGFQRVYDPTENICTRLMDWMENLKYRITIPALSKNGVVNVLGGRLVVFRKQALLPLLPKLTGEEFMDRPCISGDDGRVTSLLLEDGWRTIFQSTSMCYTIAPKTWRTLMRQRLRWQRNSNRRIINAFRDGWVMKKHWTLPFQMFTTFFMPFFFGIIMIKCLEMLFIDPFLSGYWISGLLRIVIFVVGITITRAIRTYPHLADTRYDIPLLPFYALYLMFLMWPLRMYSFMTLNTQGWVTRKVVSHGGLGDVS
jgi:N-acetylglucosaminyltransferase